LIVTTSLLGFVVSQWDTIHAETNAPSPDGKNNSFGITNGMSRNAAETLLPTFTNRTDHSLNPAGVYSEYWTKDGRRINVMYDWTGSSGADTSPSNRVKRPPFFIEPDERPTATILPNGDISKQHIISGDGRIYEGEAKSTEVSDGPDGEGVMTWLDGRKYTGQFRDGKMDGRGTMIYPDGKVEKGLWKDDKFVGASAAP